MPSLANLIPTPRQPYEDMAPAPPEEMLWSTVNTFAGTTHMPPRDHAILLSRLHPDSWQPDDSDAEPALAMVRSTYALSRESDIDFTPQEAMAMQWFTGTDMPPGQQPLPAAFIGQRLRREFGRETESTLTVFTNVFAKLNRYLDVTGTTRKTVDEYLVARAQHAYLPNFPTETVTRLSATEAEVAATHLNFVHSIVGSMFLLPRDRDHAISSGVEGLLQAAQRYDAKHGVDFPAYAGKRIKGAITDGLRAEYGINKTTKEVREPSHRRDTIFLDAPLGDETDAATYGDILPTALPGPEAVITARESAAERTTLLLRLFDPLDDQQRHVMAGLAVGKEMKEIGQEIGVSESRVSQIRKGSVTTIRRWLSSKAAEDLQLTLAYE